MSDEPTKLDITDEMIAERRGGSGQMPSDMPKWMASTITKIDLFSSVVTCIIIFRINDRTGFTKLLMVMVFLYIIPRVGSE